MGPSRVDTAKDDDSIRELLARALCLDDWEVRTAGTGSGALRLLQAFEPDAVISDVMLPDMNGLELLHRLRARAPRLPVVVLLTARDESVDRRAGLAAGANAYLLKPFGLDEVTAQLRRFQPPASHRAADHHLLVVGDLTLDVDRHQVARDGQPIQLTDGEFRLLHVLMRHPRRVLSKEQLLDRVWQYDFGGDSNVVELYISYLRRKIDKGRQPMIRTVPGGYLLTPGEAR